MVITRPLRSNEEMRDTCTREDPDADKESGKSEGIWWTGGEWQVWERSSEMQRWPGGSEKLPEAGREGEGRGGEGTGKK